MKAEDKLGLIKYYNSISRGYDELYGEEQTKKLNLVESLVSFSPHEIVLEIGCGTGLLTEKIASKVGESVGIDISYEMLRQHRDRKRADYINADAEAPPFRDESFDKVMSFTMLQDLDSVSPIFYKVASIVRKGGIVLFTLLKRVHVEGYLNALKNGSRLILVNQVEEEKDLVLLLRRDG